MYKKHIAITAAALLASSAAFSFTDESQSVYIGGNLGWGKTHLEYTDAKEQKNTGFAWGVTGGYKINQNFAIEADFVRLNDAKYPYDIRFGGERFEGDVVSKNNQFVALSVKGMVPVHEMFNVFGKIGAAYVMHDVSLAGQARVNGVNLPVKVDFKKERRIAPYFAVGAGVPVTENVEFIVQAATTTKVGNIPGMTFISGGIQFHIGV